jgi:hypothetical protein
MSWGIGGGILGFLVSELATPPFDWGLIAISAAGIGGGLGLFAGSGTILLYMSVWLTRAILADLRRWR